MVTSLKKILFLLFIGMGILILIFNPPSMLDSEIRYSFWTLCIQLLLLWISWGIILIKFRLDIFEPIGLITIIHLLLFEITPIICLYNKDTLWFGVNVWKGCVPATWISTLGYLFFLIAYFTCFKKVKCLDKKERHEVINIRKPKLCYKFNLLIWIIAFLASVILMMSEGKSFVYIISLGANGYSQTIEESASVGFLGTLAYAMIPSYLYIMELGKSKIIKIVLFYLMAATFIIRGFRFILVAVIISPLLLYYIKKGKRPHVIQMIVVLIILLAMIGFIGVIRDDVRAGAGITNDALFTFSPQMILDIFIENFSIFKTFYGLVWNIPKEMGYTLGKEIILYTAVMFVPRLIWPSKPQPILGQVLSVGVSAYASRAGTASPYIGEFYYEFGIIGVIIGMFFLGKFCKKLKKYLYKKDIHSIILYASIFPLLFQIMIRGYMPSNFYMIVIVIIPVVLTKIISNTTK